MKKVNFTKKDYFSSENSQKEYEPIIVLNFLVKPKKNYFFVRFLGLNLLKIDFFKKLRESNDFWLRG